MYMWNNRSLFQAACKLIASSLGDYIDVFQRFIKANREVITFPEK
jgi:hypothetical protein